MRFSVIFVYVTGPICKCLIFLFYFYDVLLSPSAAPTFCKYGYSLSSIFNWLYTPTYVLNLRVYSVIRPSSLIKNGLFCQKFMSLQFDQENLRFDSLSTIRLYPKEKLIKKLIANKNFPLIILL